MEITSFFQEYKPIFTVLHVLSVVVGMGAALGSDILFNFFAKDKKLDKTEVMTISTLSRIVWIGLFGIIISGVAIFFSDVARYSESSKFLAKMSIVAVLTVNGFFLSQFLWSSVISKGFFVFKKYHHLRQLAFILGTISVVSWVFSCVLGVLDRVGFSYSEIMSVYGLILVCGFVTSLFIEKKEFN
jgi:hypothetical protein